MKWNMRTILLYLFGLAAIHCQAQSSVSQQVTDEREFVNTELMEGEDSMQTLLLEEYARANGYKTPDYRVFKEKCLHYFGKRLHPTAQDYNVSIGEDIEYTINEIGRFVFTGAEGLFYQPELMDRDPTMDDARRVLYTKENGIADMFLAYNKLLFNDNQSSLSYFYRDKGKAMDIVFNLNYENNYLLTRRAIEYACQDDYFDAYVTHFLFYNNPARGYREKLIAMFYQHAASSKSCMERFENLVYAYYKDYKQINVSQDVKDECLVCLLDCLNQYDEAHQDRIFKVMDRKAYQHLSNFMSVDRGLLKRMDKSNYYGKNTLRAIAKAVELEVSTADDSTDYYIEDSDGYTNLRATGSTKARIITRVRSGCFVDVIEKSGNWWKVKTDNGKIGYIHKSRIRCN